MKSHTCWSLVAVIGLAMTSMASALCGGADDDQLCGGADDDQFKPAAPVVLPTVMQPPAPVLGPRLPGTPGTGAPLSAAQTETIIFNMITGIRIDLPPVLRGITSDPLGFMGDTMDHDDLHQRNAAPQNPVPLPPVLRGITSDPLGLTNPQPQPAAH